MEFTPSVKEAAVPARRKCQQHRLAGFALVLFLVAGGIVPLPGRAAAAPQTSAPDYVKYYVVAATYQATPENLGEVATRFLSNSARAHEIFDLNVGRVQPDGGKLTDAGQLHQGWDLVLPWDAVGSGVQYGLLPAATPPTKQAPAAPPAPSLGPTQAAPPNPPAARCAGASTHSSESQTQWATLRLAPEHAWTYTRGAGVLVAVLDSGVDASVPALSGRVTVGADIVSGSGRGDTDCLGTGTVMASIIAARSDQGGSVSGIAPDATILPVRLAINDPKPKPADQAAAIQFAVSAGARVIALGSYLTPTNPMVAEAIAQAASHDVVVVMGAPGGPSPSAPPSPGTPAASGTLASPGSTASPETPAPVLRVGGVSLDGKPTRTYTPQTVDVDAPGAQVAGVGINGTGAVTATGTQYAVAFVAGEAALVRARYPQLTAAQVIHRIEVTADRIGATAPDPAYGWGLIDPGVSVTRVIPEENQASAPLVAAPPGPGLPHGPRIVALSIIAIVSLLAVTLLVLRLRRIIRPLAVTPQPAAADEEPPTTVAALPRVDAGPPKSTVDGEQAAGDQPIGDQPAGDQLTGDQSAGEQKTRDRPAGAEPTPDRSDNAASARGGRATGNRRPWLIGVDVNAGHATDLLTREGGSDDDA
ncbi:hypothetical protein GCM10023322_54950 [Rugosimonospora acidiphila]|uniref:Peptidase S8/S53 domain-containing protein n=1 Tax=Rugosimonospora acidiphila TaxID=556531 RepID=A0ABP9SC18_9ACTN